MDFIPALIVEVIMVNGFILITYALFISVWLMAFPKEDKVADENMEIKDGDPNDADKPEEEKALLKNEEGKNDKE